MEVKSETSVEISVDVDGQLSVQASGEGLETVLDKNITRSGSTQNITLLVRTLPHSTNVARNFKSHWLSINLTGC